MADRKDFFFRQVVQENDLDEAYDGLEQADHNVVTDLGLGTVENVYDDGGIHGGLGVSDAGGYAVQVDTGTAYDSSGRRLHVPSTFTVNINATGTTGIGVGGAPQGGVSTALTPGNRRWVSVFLQFSRSLQDSRIDGSDAEVYFERLESFQFVVKMGTEAVTPTDKAVPSTGQVLLGDFRISGAGNIPHIDLIDLSRRHNWIRRVSGGAPTARVGSGYSVRGIDAPGLRTAIETLLGYYNDHVDGTADPHTGSILGFTPAASTWRDTTGLVATDVEAAINEIVTDLAADAGAARLGTAALANWINGATNPASDIQAILASFVNRLGTSTTGAAHLSAADLSGWNDGASVAPATKSIQNMLAGIVADLGLQTGNGGADKVGAGAQSKTEGSYTESVTAGSVWDHIGAILTSLALKARLAGANTFTGANTFDTSTVTFGNNLTASDANRNIPRQTVPTTNAANKFIPVLYVPDISDVPSFALYVAPELQIIGLAVNCTYNNTTNVWSRVNASAGGAGFFAFENAANPGFRVYHQHTSFTAWAHSAWAATTIRTTSSNGLVAGAASLQIRNGILTFTSAGTETNPAATTAATANTLYAKTVVKCWGFVSIAADAATIIDGFNLTSVAVDGVTDELDVTIATDMSNANYMVLTQQNDWVDTDFPAVVGTKTNGAFSLKAIVKSTGAAQNLAVGGTYYVGFVVLGLQ